MCIVQISIETVNRTNKAIIERTKLAKREGLTLPMYDVLHRKDFVKRLGGKTFDYYALAEKIASDTELLKKSFSKAWNDVIGKKQ